MTLDPQIVGPLCGAFVAGCGAFLAFLRARDRLRYMALCVTATPEQLAVLQRMPVPPPLTAGGPLLLLIVGCLLSVGVPFLSGQAHPVATLERLGVLQREQPSAADRPVDCTACKPPSRCTANGCEGSAAPAPQQPTRARAAAKHPPRLDSSIAEKPGTIDEQPELAALPEWVRR